MQLPGFEEEGYLPLRARGRVGGMDKVALGARAVIPAYGAAVSLKGTDPARRRQIGNMLIRGILGGLKKW